MEDEKERTMAMQRCRVAGLVLGAMFPVLLACNSSPTEPDGGLTFQTVVKAAFSGDQPDPQGNLAIRDQLSWRALWTLLYGDAQPLPTLDFRREMIIWVPGPSCCGDVEIVSIARVGGVLVVTAEQSDATASCIGGRFSVHVVRLPRDESPLRLEHKPSGVLC
jgi:hypothetical protein